MTAKSWCGSRSLRRLVIAAGVAILTVASVSAQSSRLPYVDIAAANVEITELEANSAERQRQNADAEASSEELLAQILVNQGDLLEIDPILARVNSELTELYEVNRSIVDDTMRGRSQEAIGRARTIKNELQRRVRLLNEAIVAAREEIEGNRERVRINNRRIKENDERIIYLQAAIAQTEAQQQRLDAFITNVDSILGDAERFVDTSDAGAQ